MSLITVLALVLDETTLKTQNGLIPILPCHELIKSEQYYLQLKLINNTVWNVNRFVKYQNV